MMETIKLPKGVKVHGFSGKSWRGAIPSNDCPSEIAEKYAPKSSAKSTAKKKSKQDTVKAD